MSNIPIPDFSEIEDKECNDSKEEKESRMAFSQSIISPLSAGETHSIQRISCSDVARIINNKWSTHFDEYVIFDCRYTQEYAFGHIVGAQNLLTYERINDFYYKNKGKKICVIFHCELSKDRGPSWAKLFRSIDRSDNIEKWPKVTFPYTFIMDGGYRKFQQEFPDLCCGIYVKMSDGRIDKNILRKDNQRYKDEVISRLGIIQTPPAPKTRSMPRPKVNPVKFNSQPFK